MRTEAGGESAWVAEAVREKLAACAQFEYLEERAARGSREAYETVLAKVPAVSPVPDTFAPSYAVIANGAGCKERDVSKTAMPSG